MEKSFERYSRYPVSIFSFAEGTRFTEKKKIDQSSEFGNLLNPKTGGIGLTLTTMPYIKLLLDFLSTMKMKEDHFGTFYAEDCLM